MLTKKIVKYIQSLSHKKFRDGEAAFIAEGPKVVAEFLMSQKYSCRVICAEKNWLYENENLVRPVSPENVYEADEQWLQRISLLKTAHKVVAVFNKSVPVAEPVIKNKIVLMLDDIQDPGNLGTIIRNADWFGIENIICSKNCADCYNPKVVQSSMGSLCRVNILYSDLISFIEENSSAKIYAAALSGTPVHELGDMSEGIILIGNESKGIHEDLFKRSCKLITIPRIGAAESLNAAVACGIILSHILPEE